MTAPTLTTSRLTLTGHRIDDLDESAALWADPGVYGMIGGQPRSREDVWIRLLRSVGLWTLFGYGNWVVRETVGGGFVGEVGLLEARRTIAPPIDAPETGWALASHAQGRGYAKEALDAVLAWSDAQRILRTMCIIDPDNAASIRLAAKIGYRAIGRATYHDRPVDLYERMAGAGANG
ncbi:GNAT family N-acetyltransferase [Sphingomonas bacterium]|uniref:GNAT family N-acetyltransferase n=1 Tax=Sphingomonas bacterium TaxID=1895847 RepID=UPI001575C811|nr:GNAT family N-acetyltransferase [Sphingomonas bacterium]